MKEKDSPPFNAENSLLRTKLRHLQRIKRFDYGWLKKHHPVIYGAMLDASRENDQRYIEAQMKKFDEGLSGTFI